LGINNLLCGRATAIAKIIKCFPSISSLWKTITNCK
jgi:hypothetical protein